MNVLFIHQNFPGQWKHLAPALAAEAGNRVVGLAMHDRPVHAPGVEVRRYKARRGSTKGIHPWSVDFETHVIRGEACAAQAIQLRQEGFVPDLICCHPGWGEALFLKEVWPAVPILGYHELHYQHTYTHFDPEFSGPASWQNAARLRAKNATFLLGYEDIDWGISPTRFQWNTLPERVRLRTSLIHDGIDVSRIGPDPAVRIRMQEQNRELDRGDTVITFVSRSLEPTRGFHRFMRALPEIQAAHPEAEIFIVGREGNGYGAGHPSGKSYKKVLLEEVEGKLSMERVHFVGTLAYGQLIKLLQLSTVHVYFTVPFVLSWSLMEAMACGALVVGSRTEPLLEVIEHGRNGLLVDFFDQAGLVAAVDEAIRERGRMEPLRREARRTVERQYDLRHCLERQRHLVGALASGAIQPMAAVSAHRGIP